MVAGNTEHLESVIKEVKMILGTVERFNNLNSSIFETYVELQVTENHYDLEANLAVLKLYQMFPNLYRHDIVCWVLLKAMANLPHTDFVLCKCLLGQEQHSDGTIQRITYLADLLELCNFKTFWKEKAMDEGEHLISSIVGFDDSIRKFICHVINITYQTIDKSILKELLGSISDAELKTWMAKNGWKEQPNDVIFICNQEDVIKNKNITEKITFDTVSVVM